MTILTIVLDISNATTCTAVVVALIVGFLTMRLSARIAIRTPSIPWEAYFGVGLFVEVVALVVLILSVVLPQPETETFASPEGTRIEVPVITSYRLPNVRERVIVNPESVHDLRVQWDALSPEEKGEALEKLLAEPDTYIWYKPTGSDEFLWSYWEDMPEEDKGLILAEIPEFSPVL